MYHHIIIFYLLELLQTLETAQKKGFVSVKWTSFALFGASGVGKTSLLNLLLRKKPVTVHHSTPVTKAPVVRLVSKEEHDDDYHKEKSMNGADSKVPEDESHVIMSDESCFWKSTDPETLKIKFLQAIKYCVRTQSDETETPEIQQSNEDQVKNTSQEAVAQTPLTSQVTPKKKFQDSLTSDHSQNKEQLHLTSEVKESKWKLLLSSKKTPKKTSPDSLPSNHSQNREQLKSMSEVKEKLLPTSKKNLQVSIFTDPSSSKIEQLQSICELQESKEKSLPISQVAPKKNPQDSWTSDHSSNKQQLHSTSEVKESKWKSLLSSKMSPRKTSPDTLPSDHS